MKLWQKGYSLDENIERFTVGNDASLDKALIAYDCLGSMAHAQMLAKIGIITHDELKELTYALNQIMEKAEKNETIIAPGDEDVHTAIEKHLTQMTGEAGKKIHTARSRNDQIILDLRLYMRDRALEIASAATALCTLLIKKADEYRDIPLPGRTHFQKAMPASVGLYWSAYAEALLDDLAVLKTAYDLINQCPLGSASGFGVSLPIDREYVADLLGFAKVQNNVLYVQNSRGKIESILIHACAQLMLDLSRMANDLIFWSAPEFGYVTLPDRLCTGSSLMPNKKNPDVLELIRAHAATVLSHYHQTTTVLHALSSGYFRDLQTTKYPLMNGCQITVDCLAISGLVIDKITINKEACRAACTREIFATDQTLELVKEGTPFRSAYQKIAGTSRDKPIDPIASLHAKTHAGAPGNLGLEKIDTNIKDMIRWHTQEQSACQQAFSTLRES